MKKGFTLIELLVVIAIIGLLASIVLVSVNSVRAKARDVNRLAGLKSIQVALEMYYDDNNAYPGSADEWLQNDICVHGSYQKLSAYLVPNYMKKVPDDPTGLTDHDHCYWYRNRNTGQGYYIIMRPEVIDPDDDDGCYSGAWYCVGLNW